ncbi:phenoloxidase 2-like [Musca vetustissima]|uniref:phenoloxidase 2-like n=1 Tax=Musca vetustissima TaxID=27455 RepID=UPI002AB7CCD5|nr:phenoloxidase 2-like [Musca vetustissima]XP_061399668.1 phenoloxidase 2-like [Musca vetustissima]XP_061399671.1 phenoloxidase 2-like [Musca vetustissima]
MSSSDTKALELLFQRPLEPVFTSRDNGKTAFDLPDSYYTDRYSSSNVELQTRYGDNVEIKIPLRDLARKPNLDFTKVIGRKQQFSLFQDQHKRVASQLITMFMDSPDLQSFVALCAYTKDRVNPMLFQYCYSVAIQHRRDTRNIRVPPIAETFPSNFVEPSLLQEARQEASLVPDPSKRSLIEIPRNYTATDAEDEQRLAYFREDIGVNMHHWHWHLVYPGSGPREIVAKDRRGELFYYMHHQIIARYNVERFCNHLKRVEVINNFRAPIADGYFPKLLSSVNNRTYPGRVANAVLRDMKRPNNVVDVADLERWRDRIMAAIDQGYVQDTAGKRYPLDEVKGIDLLGDIVEASSLSINSQYYGSLHNTVHDMIAFAHDPDGRHLEDYGVMGDVTTAMRDPVFYKWHGFLDVMFNRHKSLLPPYDQSHLSYSGITINNVEARINSRTAAPNVLLTYWQKSNVDLAAGLDFGPNGSVFATFTHLQHAPFEYIVNVTNSNGTPKKGTCRIFLCPKTDERGTQLTLEDQRALAIEMDKFTVNLTPGKNTIRRRSDESSVTIPFERSLRRVGPSAQPTEANALAAFQFCGCGWPDHLLLPKGRPEGMTFDLFVMISDYANDAVKQTNNGPDVCGDAYSFCGLKDKLYPDRRTMGFPFDRRLPGNTLTALTSSFTNLMKTDVKIIFNDQVVDRT